MTAVREFLKKRRKAELQTIHQFWYPGESRLALRDQLEKRVAQALIGGLQLSDRIARLTKTQLGMLRHLLEQGPKFEASVKAVADSLVSTGAAGLEVESAASMLIERGFMEKHRIENMSGKMECYIIPAELASRLEEVLETREVVVAPEHQLSQKRLAFEVDFDGRSLEQRIDELQDLTLIKLVRIALDNCGLAEISNHHVDEVIYSEKGNNFDFCNPDWRQALEAAEIGTIGSISLKNFGIVVSEPALIVFQEWVERHARGGLEDVLEPNTLVEAGVDLYSDIDRIASRLEAEPLNLTRDGRVPKRRLDALRNLCSLHRIESTLEGDLTDTAINATMRLGLVESYAGALRLDSERLKRWRKMELVQQAQILLNKFREESKGARWSFHQEIIRSVFIDLLRSLQPQDWVSFESLVTLTVSRYLQELEEREISENLRIRREENFSREKLNSPFGRLGSDLAYWLVNRLLPLGLCELGYCEGGLDSFRLTALGKEVMDIKRESQESRILVNPDFEIVLFCEGLRGMRIELALSRFGERVSAERIRRYRVTRESMRDGIRSGLSLEEIRSLLEEASEHPLPNSVLTALKDWGRDLDWIGVQRVLLLTGVRDGRRQEVSDYLEEEGFGFKLCDDGSIVISHGLDENQDLGAAVFTALRERGWLVREKAKHKPPLQLDSRS